MKTNFQMIKEFKDYAPKERGITSLKEMKMIQDHFHLFEMDLLALQNLRDMVVLIYKDWILGARNNGFMTEFDRLSDARQSIVAVIDIAKVNVGAKVEDL